MINSDAAASQAKPPAFFSPKVAAARRFYFDLNPSPRQRLVVVCGGLEHCTRDYSVRRETFPYFSIEYVARGAGELTLRSRTHRLCPGFLFAYGPGVPHDIRGAPADPLVKYFVDFTGRESLQWLRNCRLEPGGTA